MDEKRPTEKYCIIKFCNTEGKEKVLSISRGKYTQRKTGFINFLRATQQDFRQWSNSFKFLMENDF